MPFENMNYTQTYFENKTILRVAVPKGEYENKTIKYLHEKVSEQVKDEYLVVVVPNNVELEIVV